MKVLIVFLAIIAFVNTSLAEETLLVSDIKIETPFYSSEYLSKNKKFLNLKGLYRSIVHLKDTIKILASDGGYSYFDYKLEVNNKNELILKLNYRLKPIIKEIEISVSNTDFDKDKIFDTFPIKEGNVYSPEIFLREVQLLQSKIENFGYPNNKIFFSSKESPPYIDFNLKVELGEPLIFRGVTTNSKSAFINDFLKRKFLNLYNLPFEYLEFKKHIDQAQKDLHSYGYYLLSLEVIPKRKENRVHLEIKISNDSLFTFNFKTISSADRDTYLNLIIDLFRQYRKKLTSSLIKQGIEDFLKKQGIYQSEISILINEFNNKFNDHIFQYELQISPGRKTLLSHLKFSGNHIFSQNYLEKLFKEESFELAKNGYLDLDYISFFKELIRNKYIQNGYLQVKIEEPLITFKANNKAQVDFKIKEGSQTIIKEIHLKGISDKLRSNVFDLLKNREGGFFNPIEFTEDLKRITSFLKEEGYYFSEILNSNSENMTKFYENNSEVDLNIDIFLGKKLTVNKLIFLGNLKTRKSVLIKKIKFKPGEKITPSKLRETESSLLSTGLFNTVSVTPLKHNSKKSETDLLIKTNERDYGLVEFAPGFRTDLGLKVSGTISYLNIGGKNKSITLKSQINQRLNYQTFDPRRRKERIQLLEHNNSILFNQNDFLNTNTNLGLGSSYQRKRFYSFDADIWRVNSTFTKDLNKFLSTSLRYQWESISQFDATEDRDNGEFRIGAITPSLTYDLRNSPINPYKGAFFNLSCEFANPYFLSQEESDLTINYYKLISRNRFYLPVRNGTIAVSLVGGIQENLATATYIDSSGDRVTEGYIPNIKTFRLTGMDIVRGFNDEEINRLPDLRDISEVRIEKRAYLANLKIEPRYFINDNLVIGTFYDAGRVFVDSVNIGDLRDSVGLTFKILTPVGTLDFDYGIKLLRKKNQDGTLEDPGRFHVSIGFF